MVSVSSPLVDAHVHIWDPRVRRHAWLDSEPRLNRPFLPGDIDRGSSGVTKMIFVQADCAPDQGLDEAAWVAGLAPTWPELAGIIAFAPLEAGSVLDDHLDELGDLPLVVGVRRLLQDEPEEFFEDVRVTAGLQAVARHGLVFDACVRHHQLRALSALLERVPEATVVLDHLGKPAVADADPAGFDRWRRDLTRLAANPRVFVKLSGLAPEADPSQSFASVSRQYLDAAVEIFGTERAMAGSDWPVSANAPHPLAYDEWFDLVLSPFARAESGRDRGDVAWRTASRVYGLPC